MGRKYILADTLTRHFIYFAKLMGFYSKIRSLYKEYGEICQRRHSSYADEIQFFVKDSFYKLVDVNLRYNGRHYLNDTFVKNTYFFRNYGLTKFKEEEMNQLIGLFFDYLKDKKIYRNVRIDRS